MSTTPRPTPSEVLAKKAALQDQLAEPPADPEEHTMNAWTRDDLPHAQRLHDIFYAEPDDATDAMERIAVYLVDHLNAHHPKPDDQCEDCGVEEALKMVGDLGRGMMRAQNQRAEFRRERDTAVARAERAERERDVAVKHRDQLHMQGAPAVTRDEVEKAIRDGFDYGGTVGEVRQIADAIMPLVSGDDPAVYVVRESDLPEPVKGDDGVWRSGESSYGSRLTPEDLRKGITERLQMVANREAAARAIEAEQAVDQVEEKARELAKAGGVDFDEQEPEGVEMLLGMARYVLGREADAWDKGQEAGINDDLGDWEVAPSITSNPYRQEADQ